MANRSISHVDSRVDILRRHNEPITLTEFGAVLFASDVDIMSPALLIDLIRNPNDYKLSQTNHDWLVANGDRLLAAITAARLRQ